MWGILINQKNTNRLKNKRLVFLMVNPWGVRCMKGGDF